MLGTEFDAPLPLLTDLSCLRLVATSSIEVVWSNLVSQTGIQRCALGRRKLGVRVRFLLPSSRCFALPYRFDFTRRVSSFLSS